jgi:hypothetical protein
VSLAESPGEVRRSGRHAQSEDGFGVTDEDTMQKAMRRKAEKNLDTVGNKKSTSFTTFLILIFLPI